MIGKQYVWVMLGIFSHPENIHLLKIRLDEIKQNTIVNFVN